MDIKAVLLESRKIFNKKLVHKLLKYVVILFSITENVSYVRYIKSLYI